MHLLLFKPNDFSGYCRNEKCTYCSLNQMIFLESTLVTGLFLSQLRVYLGRLGPSPLPFQASLSMILFVAILQLDVNEIFYLILRDKFICLIQVIKFSVFFGKI